MTASLLLLFAGAVLMYMILSLFPTPTPEPKPVLARPRRGLYDIDG